MMTGKMILIGAGLYILGLVTGWVIRLALVEIICRQDWSEEGDAREEKKRITKIQKKLGTYREE